MPVGKRKELDKANNLLGMLDAGISRFFYLNEAVQILDNLAASHLNDKETLEKALEVNFKAYVMKKDAKIPSFRKNYEMVNFYQERLDRLYGRKNNNQLVS
jgi:hypothetical protein